MALRTNERLRASWLVGGAVLALAAAALSIPALGRAADPWSVGSETCQEKGPGGPLFITATCVDPVLSKPYVDIKRTGTITDAKTGIKVEFLYVHGGFTGTAAKFSYYFPASNSYKGRFFETTYPTLSREDAEEGCPQIGTSACSVVFALSHGAYVVSTNNAGGISAGSVLAPYRANAAAAKYSRTVAAQVYGTSVRPRGYLYGASGGAYQTVGSMENTSGVWDGAVPMVFGVPNAIPSFMSAQLLALRVLRDKLPQIADAVAPGGSGNPYAGLSAEQQSVLREVTRIGAPLRGWWQYATMNGGGFWAVQGIVRATDPSYADDFWSKPGYEGSEPAVQGARIRRETTVTALAGTNELLLADVPSGDLANAELQITSGPKAGKSVLMTEVTGNKVKVLSTEGITPGTRVRLDNSWLIALEYYPRHQIPSPRENGWDQYLDAHGNPLYPQRKVVTGPFLNANTAGSVADGGFHGKMIMAESAMDVMAYPWSADWYRRQAQAKHGAGASDTFRLWFMDHADHGPDLSAYENGVGFGQVNHANDHIVGYLGEVEQALLDLDDWVAKGTRPPATTGYRVDADNQIQVADTAANRHGVQPVLSLQAKGAADASRTQKVDATTGEPVEFFVNAEAPPRAGNIVKVEWDFEGTGTFEADTAVPPSRPAVALSRTHAFAKPGTFFPVVRVTSQRASEAGRPFGMVQNLAGVRVVVR
ncbi:MAG: hypothetical protein JF593_07560 [Novosphingobium sp.]|nr:hypothetical protein [Novosphingobium sp.]